MDQSQQGPTPPDFGPYETDACLLFYNDATPESNPRRLRIVKTLEGSPQEGFTYSCCMIVEDFTPLVRTTPDEIPNKRYVMKIFDSRYSRGLRKSFGCMDFTLELSKVVNNVDDAKLAEIHALTTQKISVRDSQNELLQYLFEEERIKPTITRFTLLGIALGEEGEEIREDENIELPTPDLAYQEGFLMIMQRLLYRHELEMFEQIKDLSYFPKLVATGSVCMIDTEQPKPDSKLRKFECPAIIMSLLPGESLASLVATNEDNRYRRYRGLPERDLSNSLKLTDDQWHTIHVRLHERAIYELWLRGIQHTDLRPLISCWCKTPLRLGILCLLILVR
ncbi:hypothetical protein EDD36DRAFT_421345 [Exophiala viscosa]|uniref:Uncharacterized protein n=1 Tax=Exophiala viscosa TaxID=2486360 RepID=A0AAN6DQM2_9EURO|nr:hypothetical protein EDD36DRAFT_421345 [Exophiala viscosa]